jgi:hypothetical protein
MKAGVKYSAAQRFLDFMRIDSGLVGFKKNRREDVEKYIALTKKRYPDFNYAPTRVIGGKKRWEGL